MTFQYINVIDESFDTTLDWDQLDAIVVQNRIRMSRNRSVRLPSQLWVSTMPLPNYSPPPQEKFHLLGESLNRPVPVKPMLPPFATNTQMCNYVHKKYIYSQHLMEQLQRQNSYHNKYVESLRRTKLKHHHDTELSRRLSRRVM
ncbi:hypothetical protein CANTEDRAFT_95083 [Yamadazyma tenuis ATCC 10573]|uniref:Uncharacterized protein n=1 Tax=Candida tenuis (strain ATCC 10573 / BCRC 21748 / CBS 615 / JCM 9827 / NBRC 10315 / NRRL Y-1498 / VKM Y-70) TaxID=590646 RepID=G3BBH4_CANTC|nr:uncharacterized protein CANTEDRAFT_95083 [Yamadazyma tenuis ATCC 10573]EGV62192.1 hypothetical protein CANTEDRAFT_95083 [Yamadazyma tenuis ATCC 10573]